MILEMLQGILAGGSAIALLIFSGITLTCSAVVFLISTPLFVIFSPVLVPATIATTLLATGFTASGSLLSMAMSIVSWINMKRSGSDKIQGIGSSLVQANDGDKKEMLKGQIVKKDQKKKKNSKKDIKDKEKIDKKKGKQKDR